MSTAEFIHLHNHTQYSLLDGACRIDPFIDLVKDYNMPSVAITDHGNMFGVVEFYKKAKSVGVKPIIGCEIYVAPREHTYKEPIPGKPSSGYHLILLVKNETGYRNLVKLVSKAYIDGFYHRPRVDKQLLKEHADGLIATSACLKGEIPNALIDNDQKTAEQLAKMYADMFGKENFFIEIQDHGIVLERRNKERLVKLAKKLGLGVVATNDCHYLHQKDSEAHDALLCIQTGKFLSDTDRMRYETDQIYVKSPQEMIELFGEYPDAIENTLRIAEMCNFDIELGKNHLPDFPLPSDFKNLDEYLRHEAYEGLKRRYPEITDELTQRLEFELDVIIKMGYSGYFLIVKDFTDYARGQGIPVGPGRGSATGSLVSYCLGIVNLDPMKYGLIFERFLNPERISLPDIDIDFADRGREKVIDYVINKYGEKNVCQIITFGTMAARQSIRDVGRVMQIPYADVDKIAKLIPMGPGQTISSALEHEPELRKLMEESESARELVEKSQTLEGLARHASTHAAGVVIAPKPLTEYVPLFKASKGDEITTQYDMKCIDEIGLLKMDFLGLRTLTVVDDSLRMIQDNHGVDIDLDAISLVDERVYELFGKGNTVGIFQFESSGMRDYLRKLHPEDLTDLIAMNALYRPGPLDAGTIDNYINRKHGREEVRYSHPSLEPILEETYGVIIYQEQVIRIAQVLAGYSAGQGDILRKAMGKKKKEIMEEQKKKFLEGCKKNDVPDSIAEDVFHQIETFARYGFNKSHAAGYSYLAYQTAYLKAYYPREFMAASMTSEMGNTDRVITLMEECKNIGIEVLPPDINYSRTEFTVEDDKIRFGLGAVKNVGKGAIEKILATRDEDGEFKSLFDFVSRVDLRAMNRRMLESLIKAGACESIEGHRSQLFASIEDALKFGQARQSSKANKDQASLFGEADNNIAVVEPELSPAEKWDKMAMLKNEKDLLGFYVSGHPLESYRTLMNAVATCTSESLNEFPDGTGVSIGGIVSQLRINWDKKNRKMAFVTIEDFSGVTDVIVFSALYEKCSDILESESMVMISGKVSKREDEKAVVIADKVQTLSELSEGAELILRLSLQGPSFNGGRLDKVEQIISDNPGSAEVEFILDTGTERVILKAQKLKASARPGLTRKLTDILGAGAVRWEVTSSRNRTGTE